MTLRGLLREQSGFTLPELMVALVMMTTVMFALYSIFDMSLRVFGFGNDKVEAVESARVGLDKMAREMRSAHPADSRNGRNNLFWTTGTPGTAVTPAQNGSLITFGNDLNGNRRICNSSTGALDQGEQITYSINGTTLQRNGEPLAENVSSLTFTFVDADGNVLGTNGTTHAENAIRIVRINLQVAVKRYVGSQDATQTLRTDVTLRNRSTQ